MTEDTNLHPAQQDAPPVETLHNDAAVEQDATTDKPLTDADPQEGDEPKVSAIEGKHLPEPDITAEDHKDAILADDPLAQMPSDTPEPEPVVAADVPNASLAAHSPDAFHALDPENPTATEPQNQLDAHPLTIEQSITGAPPAQGMSLEDRLAMLHDDDPTNDDALSNGSASRGLLARNLQPVSTAGNMQTVDEGQPLTHSVLIPRDHTTDRTVTFRNGMTVANVTVGVPFSVTEAIHEAMLCSDIPFTSNAL